MTILCTNYSTALLALCENGRPPISAVEVGPWFTVQEIEEAVRKLPQFDFHFHASSMLTSSLRLSPAVGRFQAYHAVTNSPWVTPHIDLLPPGYLRAARRFNITLPIPGRQRMTERFIKRIKQLKQAMDIPIVLENMPSLRNHWNHFQSQTQRISYILEQTGCDMLLDISHARVAASLHQMTIFDYLNQLPLHKVVHLHISGAREQDGWLQDAHEPLQEADYQILQWLFAQIRPRVLTLEYFRDPAALDEQLNHLADLLPATH